MKTRALLIAVLMTSAFPASAAVTVLGGGLAHSCYLAAESKRPVRTGLLDCESALKEEVLSQVDRAATFVNRGILFMFLNDYPNAIENYDAALKIDPKLAEAYVNKGIAVLRQGTNNAYAIDLLSKGLQFDPQRPEVAFYSRGVANELSGNTKEAYYDYTQAATLKPEWEAPQQELKRFKVISQ